mmetsp:Transcript_476/g.1318  ORF Transcript_476/g.1318 Transcript_476/m.1318 type:complete len:84 (+) Transcript_476:1045-1296(+)
MFFDCLFGGEGPRVAVATGRELGLGLRLAPVAPSYGRLPWAGSGVSATEGGLEGTCIEDMCSERIAFTTPFSKRTSQQLASKS